MDITVMKKIMYIFINENIPYSRGIKAIVIVISVY